MPIQDKLCHELADSRQLKKLYDVNFFVKFLLGFFVTFKSMQAPLKTKLSLATTIAEL